MIAVTMEQQAVKGFMNRLIREDVLDAFEARACELVLNARISINGALEAPPATEGEEETRPQNLGHIAWEDLRPLIFAIIKTGAKPKMIKIVFSYKAAQAKAIHPNAAALFLNMVYENDAVTFTTATAQREFALDKSLDDTWDEWVRGFFVQNGIVVADRE